MDRYTELLMELGSEIGQPLHPDKRGVCKLNVNDLFHVQIENDLQKEALLIATFIGEIIPGKFRENILREALKANQDVHLGILGYSGKNNQLALFSYLPVRAIHGKELLGFLNEFIEKASSWRTALESGVIPTPKKP